MPTITNRSLLSKGRIRDRENLSKRLRCVHLGEMTQKEFKIRIEKLAYSPDSVTRTIEFYRNKATIHLNDGHMFQYSYNRINSITSLLHPHQIVNTNTSMKILFNPLPII
jgi:hypothetical protein